MSYFYASNLDSLDRRDQLEFQLDNGDTAILQIGHYYDLTASELARARQYIVLTYSDASPDEEPIGVVYLPVKGNPTDGQMLMWEVNDGAFIPSDVPGVSGGPFATEASLDATQAMLDDAVAFRDAPAPDALLRKAFSARLAAARATGLPMDFAFVGDSETEGTGVTDRSDRWQDLLISDLRDRFQPPGVPGGEGYVPAFYNSSTLTDRWTSTGTAPTEGSSFGPGKRNWQFAAGTVASLVFWGTRADVLTARGALGGTCDIAVDGGAATTVNMNGSVLDAVVTSFPGLAQGLHTLTVTATGGAQTFLDGAMVYDGDESKGIRQWDCARHGATALSTSGANTACYGLMQPALVIIGIGTNDYGNNQPPDTTVGYIQTSIDGIRAKCTVPPTVVLWTQWGRYRASPTYQWSEYVQAMKNMVTADGDILLVDIDKRWGFFASGNVADDPYDLLDADGTHASPIGHRAQADIFMGALTPR